MLSVDFDPIDDRIAAIGYRRVEAGKVSNQHVHVPASGSAVDEAEAMVAVLPALVADLTEIDAHNAALPQQGNGEEGTYPHTFFYEPADATNPQRSYGQHQAVERVRRHMF